MMKRYGLGWLDLEVALAADLTFSTMKIINAEKTDQDERFMLDVYLKLQQTYAINTLFSDKPDPFPTFEQFKVPKTEEKTLEINDKERLKKEAERIKKKFGG